MDKEAVKSIYAEFIGYLSQIPMSTGPKDMLNDESLWTQYNDSVNCLKKVSDNDYTAFLVKPIEFYGSRSISLITFRSKLGGLISKLHTEYFPELAEPFSGQPSVVITQTQQQSQLMFVQALLDLQSKIDEKLPTLKEGSNEKPFLQKLKSTLSSTQNIIGLITQILTLAKASGVSVEDLQKLFGT